MADLRPLLPPSLVDFLAAAPGLPDVPHVTRRPGALLVADVSGFTTLTERLQARGRAGAEEAASVVGRAFRPVLRAIRSAGGGIVSFAGDAVLAAFLGPRPVKDALRAAREIQARQRAGARLRTSLGLVRLGIKQAIHHGAIHELHVGHAGERHYLLCGPAAREIARLEKRAAPGGILLSAAARARRGAERGPRRPPPARPAPREELLRPYVRPHALEALGGEGQYRRVVVLFLEVRGHDPRAMQGFFATMVDALHAHQGTLVSSDISPSGTKWVCGFGAAEAHEDDHDRAVRTAMAVRDGVPAGVRLRAGIHAGVAAVLWVGDASRRSLETMGDVTNTAARALARARWGEILVTRQVRERVGGVATEDRGARAAKGKRDPLSLHAVVGVRATPAAIRVSAPMIGRDADLRRLAEGLSRAAEGRGEVVGIRGEAGLGKSRLRWEAAKIARERGFRIVEATCRPSGGRPFHAMRELAASALGLTADDLSAVRGAVAALGLAPGARTHLDAILGREVAPPPGSPRDWMTNAIAAVRELLAALARERPLLLAVEDVQWADELMRGLLARLPEHAAGSAMLAVLAYRPEYTPPPGVEEIEVRALGAPEMEELSRCLLGNVPAATAELARERAAGNPFYLEEVARHLEEASRDAARRDEAPEELPQGIESLLAARFDRLGSPARRVLHYAAILGQFFPGAIVSRIPELAADGQDGLAELVAREIVFPQEGGRYVFKHAITRDVAYAAMLEGPRRRRHRTIAETLEGLGQDGPAVLALHWDRGGVPSRARAGYLAAAREALRAFAAEEAGAHFRRCLELLRGRPEEAIDVRIELAEKALDAFGRSAEALPLLERARRAARVRRDARREARAGLGMARALDNLGRLEEAHAAVRDAAAAARRARDRQAGARAVGLEAIVALHLGRTDESESLFRRARRAHRTLGDRRAEATVLGNMGVAMHRGRGLVAARSCYREALAIARTIGDREIEADMLQRIATVDHESGRLRQAEAGLTSAIELRRRWGQLREEASGILNLASIHASQGRHAEALELNRRCDELAVRTGDRRLESYAKGALAGCHMQLDDDATAIALTEEAWRIARESGDRMLEGAWMGNLVALYERQGRLPEAVTLCTEAIAVCEEVRYRRFEGYLRSVLGDLTLLVRGDVGEARRLCDHALAQLEAQGEVLLLGTAACRRGFVALAAGEDPGPWLRKAQSCLEGIGDASTGEVRVFTDHLARSAAAAAAGLPLVGGRTPDGISPAVLRFVTENPPPRP